MMLFKVEWDYDPSAPDGNMGTCLWEQHAVVKSTSAKALEGSGLWLPMRLD